MLRQITRFFDWLDDKRSIPNGIFLSLLILLTVAVYRLPSWIEGYAILAVALILARDFAVMITKRPRRCSQRYDFGLNSQGRGMRCWRRAGHPDVHMTGNKTLPIRWRDDE